MVMHCLLETSEGGVGLNSHRKVVPQMGEKREKILEVRRKAWILGVEPGEGYWKGVLSWRRSRDSQNASERRGSKTRGEVIKFDLKTKRFIYLFNLKLLVIHH